MFFQGRVHRQAGRTGPEVRCVPEQCISAVNEKFIYSTQTAIFNSFRDMVYMCRVFYD